MVGQNGPKRDQVQIWYRNEKKKMVLVPIVLTKMKAMRFRLFVNATFVKYPKADHLKPM